MDIFEEEEDDTYIQYNNGIASTIEEEHSNPPEPIPEQPEDQEDQSQDSNTWWPSGYYFGHGSGGEYSRYPSLSR